MNIPDAFSDASAGAPPTFSRSVTMVAMISSPLRLVEPSQLERRLFPRKEVHTRVEGRRIDHSIAAHRDPHVSLALRDLSLGGLSAITQTPIARGERIAVFFPPQGARRGWDACGRVLRCEPSALGYRVAVEFDPLPAA
jgi:hypothetical protein